MSSAARRNLWLPGEKQQITKGATRRVPMFHAVARKFHSIY